MFIILANVILPNLIFTFLLAQELFLNFFFTINFLYLFCLLFMLMYFTLVLSVLIFNEFLD